MPKKKPKARGPGRPELPDAERRGEVVTVRLQPGERKAVEAAAKRAGIRPSAWMRKVLAEAAEKQA